MKKYLAFFVCLTAGAFADVASEPTTYKHTVSPIVQFNEHSFRSMRGNKTWIGLEYNFIQNLGYNLKIVSTSANSSKYNRSTNFLISNSYKMNCYNDSIIYPMLGLEMKNTLHHAISYEGDVGEEKIKIFAGVGVQKSLNNWLTISPEIVVAQELVNKFLLKQARQKAYSKERFTRNSWYGVSLGLKANMTDRLSFEMVPYYSGTFERDYFERGVKTSMAFAF